ncbi:hypothetical protein [Chlorogloea sp. CCALA 695]|uniref:hypothetical protein n=1 Tax=Chlorogloea sp. CCALA 695 TaxID=2107693 RepID=UPI000D062F00|nr:hypothetical protein [Chlorogloea sp. CCALA 695]PSB35426.1 hypothetical protein C7B70_00885 [Chlorogloea sp. CCALA 695]
MKRRNLLRILGFAIPLSGVALLVPKASGATRKVKKAFIKNKSIEFVEDSDEPNTTQVKVKGKKFDRSFQIKKKNNKFVTGYFPFGDEFTSLEELTAEVIESGQLDLD